MAQKWKDQDSARTMTRKYNEMVEQVNSYEQSNKSTEQTAEDVRKLLDGKVDKETAKADLSIDKVDNTPDMDKPVSNPQMRAIELATEDMITSETVNEIDGPEPSTLVNMFIQGSKLILSTNTAQVARKVLVYVKNSKLVLISTN